MSPEQWEMVRLSAGAFFTSPGFGGVAALAAAGVAYQKYRSDAAEAASQQTSDETWRVEQDSRDRWLTTFSWVSDRYLEGLVPKGRWFDALESLNDLATTREQTQLLDTAIEMQPRRSDGHE